MDIIGELTTSSVLIKKPSDVGRLYNKSRLGTPLSGNLLRLHLIEAVFLLDEGKMRLYQKKKHVDFESLVRRAAQTIPEFETKYLVFKDLRNRGHAITITENAPVAFQQVKQKNDSKPSSVIAAFSERDYLDINATKQLLQKTIKNNETLWYALVDEEGDITYYEVSLVTMKGDIKPQDYPTSRGMLLKNRLLLFEKNKASELLQKEFFGKPFGEGLQLSFVEAVYLSKRNALEIEDPDGKILSEKTCISLMKEFQPDILQRLIVFMDLKQKGLLVKTGFKFGAHFRAYTKQPEKTHAEYLLHIIPAGFTSVWAEISRAVRLAHSVNKEFIFACIDDKTIQYIKLGRLRP